MDIARLLRETFVRRVEHHQVLASTNDRAAQCARERGVRLPLLVMANQQTAGRGRGANRWWTGPGSLAFSLLVEADTVGADRRRSPLVALAVGLAVADSVAPLLPGRRVGIRWPNDMVVAEAPTDDRKLAGILVEVLPDGRHVIGIGLNSNNTLADAPANLATTVCTLRDLTGAGQDETSLLIRLLRGLERGFAQLRSSPLEIGNRANALCVQRGRPLTIENGGKRVTGTCRGIAADGALWLDTAAGPARFVSGSTRYA